MKVRGGSDSCMYGREWDDVRCTGSNGFGNKSTTRMGGAKCPASKEEGGRDESRGSLLSDCPFKPDGLTSWSSSFVITTDVPISIRYQVSHPSSLFQSRVLSCRPEPNVHIDRRPSKLSASMVAPIREEARRLISRSAILYHPSQGRRLVRNFDRASVRVFSRFDLYISTYSAKKEVEIRKEPLSARSK